jgi:type I restriction enzyme S subunit
MSATVIEPATASTFQHSELGPVAADWALCPVQQMGGVLTGKALASRAPGTQRPYLRTKNVFDGRIDLDDVLSMPMTDVQFDNFEVIPGDVLLNEGQSLELVGRCALYRGEYGERCAMQNQLIRFRAKQGVSPEYAAQLFRFCQQTGVFARIALQTTSIAHLGGSRFAALVLPWPPPDEQEAVAAALSDVDAVIDDLDKLIGKKRAIKIAVMQGLLRGRARIAGFKDPWKTITLGELADIQRGASPRPIDSPIWFDPNSQVGWVRISDLSITGMYLQETAQKLSKLGVQNSRPVARGSLIMSICATVNACQHDGDADWKSLKQTSGAGGKSRACSARSAQR